MDIFIPIKYVDSLFFLPTMLPEICPLMCFGDFKAGRKILT